MNTEKMKKGYNIAIHGIKKEQGSKEIAETIMQEGLTLYKGARSIRSTTVQLGDKYRNDNIEEDVKNVLKNYTYGAYSEGYNIIIRTPTVVENSKGDALFLGDPYTGDHSQDFATSGQQYEETCMLDIVCEKLGKIPPEFVYGYFHTDDKGNTTIKKNPSHYTNHINDKEKMDELFDLIQRNLGKTEIEISRALAKDDKATLETYKKLASVYNLTEFDGIIQKAESQYADEEIERETEDPER